MIDLLPLLSSSPCQFLKKITFIQSQMKLVYILSDLFVSYTLLTYNFLNIHLSFYINQSLKYTNCIQIIICNISNAEYYSEIMHLLKVYKKYMRSSSPLSSESLE